MSPNQKLILNFIEQIIEIAQIEDFKNNIATGKEAPNTQSAVEGHLKNLLELCKKEFDKV